MLRLLAVCGLLTISLSYETGDEDDLLLQEDSSRKVRDVEGREFVPWPEARGYHECEEFKRPCRSNHGRKMCTGCLKPKPRSEICEEVECPPIEEIASSACGFEARKLLSAKWAVSSIDISDFTQSYTDALKRLNKYLKGANNQGRMADSAYKVTRRVWDDNFNLESAKLAFYIPSSFQANPPTPNDELVTVETWDDAITYNRAFGGERVDNTVYRENVNRQFRLLRRALEKADIAPPTKVSMNFVWLKEGCAGQRTEMVLVE